MGQIFSGAYILLEGTSHFQNGGRYTCLGF